MWPFEVNAVSGNKHHTHTHTHACTHTHTHARTHTHTDFFPQHGYLVYPVPIFNNIKDSNMAVSIVQRLHGTKRKKTYNQGLSPCAEKYPPVVCLVIFQVRVLLSVYAHFIVLCLVLITVYQHT